MDRTEIKAEDEIDRICLTYTRLPESVDLRLNADGIHLRTSDFASLIAESAGVDLQSYFSDAVKDLPLILPSEKSDLAKGIAAVFNNLTTVVCGKGGVLLQRRLKTQIPLPAIITQGLVEAMEIGEELQFRIKRDRHDELLLYDILGVRLLSGGKLLNLQRLHWQIRNGKCYLRPYFEARGRMAYQGTFKQRALTAFKELIVTMLATVPAIAWPVDVRVEDFRSNFAIADLFLELMREPDKDAILLFEKAARCNITDPVTTALLRRAKHIKKNKESIEIQRDAESVFDLGGPSLKLACDIKFDWRRFADRLQIENISGAQLGLPFEPPGEWQSLGIDLGKTIPRAITNLSFAQRDNKNVRKLVADTAPGCWLSVDLGDNLLPTQDANGNWCIFGAASNPISGSPQRFFMRFDKRNNLNMSPREIAQVVTQTASEGFDPNDPSTWTWAAVALGGRTLLAAEEAVKDGAVPEKLKDGARKLGRIIGKIMRDI